MIFLVIAFSQLKIRIDITSDVNLILLNKMHQPLLKRAQPLLSKKIRHHKINKQILQRGKHQLLPRKLLPLSSIKLHKVSLLLNNKEIRKPLQIR
jgi:hypothetical protein